MGKRKKPAPGRKPGKPEQPARQDISSAPPERRSTPQDKIRLPEIPAHRWRGGGKPPAEQPKADPADYYRLKTRAVEDLVTANEENSPPVSPREIRQYHTGSRLRVADWVKALFLKFWLGGVVCYFFLWGLSGIALNPWDQILILGIALGGLTNLITNNVFRFIAKTKGAYDRWMMFPRKGVAFFLLDILYGIVLILCVMMTYNGINMAFSGGADTAALGVEPLGFGLIVLGLDLLFLGLKRLGGRILDDAKKQARKQA